MTLGFRYWMGIGVKEDCMRALDWYESVAHKGEFYMKGGKMGMR
jgi:SEL1 protein